MKEKTTLTDEAYRLYKTISDCMDKENQASEYYVKLQRVRFIASRRWCRRRDNASNTGKEVVVNKSKAGRPRKDDKKIPIGVKLPPWLNDWMNRQPESKAVLIETALIAHYQIPEHLQS